MVNRENYLLVKSYLVYLSQVSQLDARSIGRYWSYLRHLLLWADETTFSQSATVEPAFPAYLAEVRLDGKAGNLSPVTMKKITQTTKRFFTWAKMTYARKFRGLPLAWIDALRAPRGTQPAEDHRYVTLDEVRRLIALDVPEGDLASWRDQAAAALLFVSGMRVGALGTLPIEALDLPNRAVKQWPSLGVATKNGKSATTYLLDIPDLLSVVGSWDAFIRDHVSPNAAWYTPTDHNWGEQRLSTEPVGSNRNVAIARRMRKLFTTANLPYKSPHKFRHGHAVYALQRAKTMADYKAVSMNLMHDDIRVTDGIYAPLVSDEVRQRVGQLTGQTTARLAANGDLAELIRGMPDIQVSQALVVIAERLAQ